MQQPLRTKHEGPDRSRYRACAVWPDFHISGNGVSQECAARQYFGRLRNTPLQKASLASKRCRDADLLEFSEPLVRDAVDHLVQPTSNSQQEGKSSCREDMPRRTSAGTRVHSAMLSERIPETWESRSCRELIAPYVGHIHFHRRRTIQEVIRPGILSLFRERQRVANEPPNRRDGLSQYLQVKTGDQVFFLVHVEAVEPRYP